MSAGLDREKLVAVLGMLGSAHDGEILSAARQAERLRTGAGVSWADVLQPAPERPSEPKPRDAFAACDFCLGFLDAGVLSGWEIDFLRDIGIRAARGMLRGGVSDKQAAALTRIVAKMPTGKGRAA